MARKAPDYWMLILSLENNQADGKTVSRERGMMTRIIKN